VSILKFTIKHLFILHTLQMISLLQLNFSVYFKIWVSPDFFLIGIIYFLNSTVDVTKSILKNLFRSACILSRFFFLQDLVFQFKC